LKREPITRLNERAAGPRVDLQGNIYVAECGRPNSPALPEFFNGKVPEIKEKELEKVPTAANSYSWGYGSIVKFSPQGGEIAWPMTMWANAAYEAKANYKKWQGNVPGSMEFDFYGPRGPQQMAKAPVKGALWVHMGAYPVAAHANTCACMGYTFDVDYYGRSFYPEAARSRVGILDSNGNEIGFFGRYGNRDDARSDGTTPLAMPIAAAVTDRFVYVGDVNNQCLARVKLTHAAEETCDVK
jgi:hypothetical protein